MRPKVHTEKHFNQKSLFTVASGAILNQTILTAVAVPSAAVQVREGCTISAIYIEMWFTSDDVSQGSVIVTLEKVPGATTALIAVGQIAALNDYINKKNILHTQMGLIGPNTQYPMQIVKGWFKIPKSKQRFGLNDRLVFSIFGQSNGVQGCGFFLYKEQY